MTASSFVWSDLVGLSGYKGTYRVHSPTQALRPPTPTDRYPQQTFPLPQSARPFGPQVKSRCLFGEREVIFLVTSGVCPESPRRIPPSP